MDVWPSLIIGIGIPKIILIILFLWQNIGGACFSYFFILNKKKFKLFDNDYMDVFGCHGFYIKINKFVLNFYNKAIAGAWGVICTGKYLIFNKIMLYYYI